MRNCSEENTRSASKQSSDKEINIDVTMDLTSQRQQD